MAVKNRPVRPDRERANPFNNKPELLTDPVFLIGNGKSRNNFDLERLRGLGTIIGCNALYRDFAPDVLVAIDAKMIKEINESNYWKDHTTLIPATRSADLKNSLKYRVDQFNTSGCFSMKLIGECMRPSFCYMLGMDGYPGNVYDKTKNYAQNTLQNFSGVLKYYYQTLRNPNYNTMFVNVNEKDAWGAEATDSQHYSFMTYDKFEEVLSELKNRQSE